MEKLNTKALSRAMAMLALVMWIVGVIVHGIFGQPSLIPLLYSWFNYSNPVHALLLGAVWIVSFYVIGYLIAVFYNLNLKKK